MSHTTGASVAAVRLGRTAVAAWGAEGGVVVPPEPAVVAPEPSVAVCGACREGAGWRTLRPFSSNLKAAATSADEGRALREARGGVAG